MIVLHPVLEILGTGDFDLWPVADSGTYGFLPLSGRLGTEEAGTAVMRIAECNTVDPADEEHPQRPADPLGGFLHGLLTAEGPFAAGGLRVTDTATGVTLLPGCCNGLDERRDWFEVLDGDGWAGFGHDPSPLAERVGDGVRLTVDTDRADSPVIELPVTDLRRLLADAERDLADFHRLATEWTTRYVPDHATAVADAVARALALPAPTEGR
ncbi:hypothetical protein [Streptomyces sp. NBC_00233]|uniref:hypothetical protein n=1 Tax=Streptomyces sp. NBC_00233 TaxID=2975686 RepID=UPI0022572254|nr:hypothetical protein [Streptomyces sp. NBC_00233]MCX5228608.1 hypothetical protein [Streptomyces sp. NBC_00233]